MSQKQVLDPRHAAGVESGAAKHRGDGDTQPSWVLKGVQPRKGGMVSLTEL